MLPFVEWRAAITAALTRADDATARRYSAQGRLTHFERLSDDVLARFECVALAQAAFLHGVAPAGRPLLDALPEVSEEVIGLLDDRHRLRALGSGGAGRRTGRPEFVRPVMTNLLRAIRDRRAMLLFVFEQLRHLDERGEVAAWQRRFVQTPEPFPLDAYAPNPEDRFTDRTERAEFLRHVVAPVAEAIGLWQERNLAENLALVQTNEALFLDTVAEVLMSVGGAPAEFAAAVTEAADAPAEWQWRHVDSIVRRQRWDRPDRKAWRVERAGYLLVRCVDAAGCYAVLGRLHHRFEHVPEALRDLMSLDGRASGYAAIHTRVEVRDLHGGNARFVSVHLMEEREAARRLSGAGVEHLRAVAAHRPEAAAESLRIVAYDGRVYYIPRDGTVLNFAYAVHSGSLAHLRGATVNQRPVSVLQRLRDGDVVWLDIASTFEPLPATWRDHVPPDSRRKLEQAYAHALKPTLRDDGRRWLRRRLQLVTDIELTDEQLDALVSDVNRAVLPRHLHATSTILLELGLVDQQERGMTPVRAVRLPPGVAESIAEAVIARVRAGVRRVTEVDIPADLRDAADRVVACTACSPRTDEDLAATLIDGQLEVHRRWAPCATDAQPLPRAERAVHRQYYVVETENRSGIGVEILRVFHDEAVDVEEISAQRLGTGWSVIRCGIDFASLPRRNRVTAGLQAISGVRRVVHPDAAPVPLLEDVLPHRSDGALPLWTKAPPYQVGPAVEDDRLFYGMDAEVGTLEQAFRGSLAHGQLAFVQGPLRTGKTSIAKRFLRLRGTDHQRPSVVTYEFAQGKSWSEVSTSLVRALDAQAGSTLRAATVDQWVRAFRASDATPVVIVIDEAVGVFATATPEEAAAIRAFADTVRRLPGVVVVFVGPTAGLRRVDRKLAHLLQSATAVPSGELSRANILRMLRAEKLAGTYRIAVPESVAKAVHRLTSGNPYWVAELANLMFSLNDRGIDATDVIFTPTLLDAAVAWSLRRGLAFLDRRPENELERAIVTAILHPGASERPRALTTEALYEAVRTSDGPTDRDTFNASLDVLDQRGTIRFARSAWRISAPLLERYLRREFERRL